jgi:mono/diheme cytochrome c family protein
VGSEAQQQSGKALYDKYCSQCHGDNGDGRGIAAAYVKPRPRDFTLGKYKVRTTPTGALPTTDDLKKIIRVGMPYSTMPGWPGFSDAELTDLAYYLKTFYSGFANADENGEPLDFPSAPSYSEESASRGAEIYVNLGCAQCHGDSGRGNGTSAPTLADDWGYHIRPADLTKPWTFRGGSSRADVYRTVVTGLNGTPMPSYADEGALPQADRWALVDYIFSLAGGLDPDYASLLTAVGVEEGIDIALGEALFESAPPARFPIVGQIMEPGRNFYPAITDVEVRAIFDSSDVALLVQWNDMSAETGASNHPSLEAPQFDPVEEEVAQRRAKEEGAATDDFWGDPFAEESEETVDEPAPGEEESVEALYSDAVAVQLPLNSPTGIKKPYFVLGSPGNPVDLWFVDLASGLPQAFTATGSDSLEEAQQETLKASVSHQEGRWTAIFSRKRSSVRGVSFNEGEFLPIAFSVWDGFNKERGNKRGLTSWSYVYLEPTEKPSPVVPMIRNSAGVFIAMILIVFIVRRKYPAKQEDKE